MLKVTFYTTCNCLIGEPAVAWHWWAEIVRATAVNLSAESAQTLLLPLLRHISPAF
jgi:hypothetical protein